MSKRGRRPRGRTPMPATTITALTDELTFLMILGGGATSLGAQQAVSRLVKLDEEAADLYKQAIWMRERAEEELKRQGQSTLSQADVYKHISANYFRMADEWKSQSG